MKNLLKLLRRIRLPQLWKNLIPKKNQDQMQFDENKLISLMENFSGAKFQWIKTNRPELLGKVVTCRNIEPRGDRFFALFDDGSSVDTAQLNTSLLMIHGDMQPLSKAEVESISGPKRPTVQPRVNQTQTMPPNSLEQNGDAQPRHFQQAQPTTNMFEMFNSEERKIDLQVTMNLPEQDFLKMMYSNAKDKEKFLSELSDYVFRAINKTVIQSAISDMVVPLKTQRSKSGPTVNITEIHEE
jgi:hypothetical protein